MRKLLLFLSVIVFALSSCKNEDINDYKVSKVTIKLIYPDGFEPNEGVEVRMKNSSSGSEFKSKTTPQGIASFEVPQGIYEASASESRSVNQEGYMINGLNSSVSVNAEKIEAQISMEISTSGSVVIKEMYVGGCPKDDGSGAFAMDQYLILYNNSYATINIGDFALGMVNPYNPHASNKDYVNGELVYAKEGWIPAGTAVWYFDKDIQLESGEQIVIALNGAIDHTKTYTQSVNLSDKDYYCLYDIEDFDNAKYYPSPSENIPTENYLKAYKYGVGNAWPVSQFGPAFFVFRPDGTSLKSFVEDTSTTNLYGGNATQARKKVPVDWIVDGVEVFVKGVDTNQKRLLPMVDAGYVEHTNKLGYSIYRNVDKEATEAIKENEGKIVYNYSLGVDASTDPSGIDAEASLKNGAKIIYKDTNNSSNDFHLRSRASIRN